MKVYEKRFYHEKHWTQTHLSVGSDDSHLSIQAPSAVRVGTLFQLKFSFNELFQASCSWPQSLLKEQAVTRGSLLHNHGWHLHTVPRGELCGRSPVVGQHRERPQLGVSAYICTLFIQRDGALKMASVGPLSSVDFNGSHLRWFCARACLCVFTKLSLAHQSWSNSFHNVLSLLLHTCCYCWASPSFAYSSWVFFPPGFLNFSPYDVIPQKLCI